MQKVGAFKGFVLKPTLFAKRQNVKFQATGGQVVLVKNDIKTILGGGDIVAAATNNKQKDKVYHASTGGGATLEYLEGKKLPGIEAIK